MTKNRWRRRPQLEGLESKLFLSGIAAPTPHPAALHTQAHLARPKAHPTAAPVQGFYFSTQANPDTGTIYHFFANGKVLPFNFTFITGTVQTPGNIANGTATGNLHLAARGGAVSLALTQTPGSSTDPTTGPLQFQFTLAQGTGKYQNVTGTGTVFIQITPFDATSAKGSGGGRVALDFRTA